MLEMPIQCAMCGINKNPNLMYSSDTCHECAEDFRFCAECNKSTLAKFWRDCLCPLCGATGAGSGTSTGTGSGTSTGTASVRATNSKPSIIDTLLTLGWFVFVMSGLSGIFFISQDGGGILGVSLIIAGVFQLSIFLGFSAIIDQLYKINVNTSKPDKSDKSDS